MTTNTKIEWADHTFTPWWGCTKISPACDNCYAQALDKRTGGDHWGAGNPRKRTSDKNWLEPVKWNKQADAFMAENGRRQRVFCASMADVFDNAVDPQWRINLFALIRATPNLDWLLLTKRIGNAANMIGLAIDKLPIDDQCGMGQWNHHPIAQWPWENIWLGATICNQEEADRDIPKLLDVPAAKRFLSVEPMLGAIDLCELEAGGVDENIIPRKYWTDVDDDDSHPALVIDALTGWQHQRLGDWTRKGESVDWIICGGESGHSARPMHPDWARSLRDQCAATGVPFLFKQWGEWYPRNQWEHSPDLVLPDIPDTSHPYGQPKNYLFEGGEDFHKIGKKPAGRLLDGVEHNGVPVLATNA